MTKLKRVLCAIAAACGTSCGGSSPGGGSVAPPPICQPLVTSKVSDKFNVRNVGDSPIPATIGAWDMNARYLGTGFVVSNRTAGNANANVMWGEGFYSGSFSLTPEDYQPVVGGGPQFVYSIDLQNTQMRPMEFSFDASVNAFSGTGIGQLVFFIYAKHKTTGRYVVVLWALFDNRYDNYDRFVGNDTYIDFISMPVHAMSAARMEMNPYVLKHYSINITPQRWATFTTEPIENYELVITGFLQEAFIENGKSIALSATVKNIKVTDVACDSPPAGEDLTQTP